MHFEKCVYLLKFPLQPDNNQYIMLGNDWAGTLVLTQWISLAILVRDGEDSDDGVAVLPQLLVNLLAEQTLSYHCNLHPHASLCSKRGSNTPYVWM